MTKYYSASTIEEFNLEVPIGSVITYEKRFLSGNFATAVTTSVAYAPFGERPRVNVSNHDPILLCDIVRQEKQPTR